MIKVSWRRILALTRKEIFHITRDPITLGAAIGLPIFMVLVFGMAIEFNVKNIDLSVYDADQTQTSRQLIETFDSSEYFIVNYVNSPEAGIDKLISNRARAALIIPPYFQRDLFAGRTGEVQILLDGSDSSTVIPITGYINRIESLASRRITNFDTNLPYELRVRYLFNPELNSRWFVIPGLNVVVMGIMSIILTAPIVAREYERGSMELLLSTPLQPIEIIIGKLIPYAILGLLIVALIYFLARAVFDVPFLGQHWVFLLGTLLFLICYLTQGVLISIVTRNQLLALQLGMISGLLPTQLLSGFIFPVESMPQVMQYATGALPARWFMEVSRGSFLQGTSFQQLLIPFLGLFLFCSLVITLSVRTFKRTLS